MCKSELYTAGLPAMICLYRELEQPGWAFPQRSIYRRLEAGWRLPAVRYRTARLAGGMYSGAALYLAWP